MKDLIPLLTTIVAVAGTLGGVFINNINTNRRDMNKFKREILETIFEIANKIFYRLTRDDGEHFRYGLKINLPDNHSKEEISAAETKIDELQKSVADEFIQLESKFDMFVSFYFKNLSSPAEEFLFACSTYLEERGKRDSSTLVLRNEMLLKKDALLEQIRVEIDKLKP